MTREERDEVREKWPTHYATAKLASQLRRAIRGTTYGPPDEPQQLLILEAMGRLMTEWSHHQKLCREQG